MQEQNSRRGPGKYIADYTLKDAYIYYINSLSDKESVYNVKKDVYRDICEDFNESVIKLMINNAFEFKAPGMGKFKIRARKPRIRLRDDKYLYTRNLAVDYKATKELWKNDEDSRINKRLIFLRNEHSNGYTFAFNWSKRDLKLVGGSVYAFITTRANKRYLAKQIKTRPELSFETITKY